MPGYRSNNAGSEFYSTAPSSPALLFSCARGRVYERIFISDLAENRRPARLKVKAEMSAVEESPPDEDPGVMANHKVVAVHCSKVTSEAENEPAMLDEEEMPSYVSLASLQIPEDSKIDQSVVEPITTAEHVAERAQSPFTSEHGAESVCVLSSGEESDRRPFEAMEDYDSEEMDMEEEEEDEEEDEEEEEDSDGDIEPEQFERSSDDFVLRYDSGLEKHHKERSRSLQDLTNSSRGNLSRFVGKRRSIDHMGGPFEPEFTREFRTLEDPLDVRKRSNRGQKYGHVTSKVKLYIQEMKEQRRRSAEHASRAIPDQQKQLDDVNSRDADVTSVPQNLKRIKSYVRNAINEMKTCIEDDANCVDPRAVKDTVDHGSLRTEAITDNVSISNEPSPENLAKRPRISLKTNGLADHVTKDEQSLRHPEINHGPRDVPRIFDLRSLTFEEYTNGDEKVENPSSRPFPAQEKNDITVEYTETIQPQTEAQKATSEREVDKVARLQRVEVPRAARNTENLRESPPDQLSRRKMILVDSELYQKMIEENATVKRELDETRKSLEQSRAEIRELEEVRKKYEQQMASNVPPETSVASVQTERTESEEKKNDATTSPKEETSSKLLSSTVTSALSSIEQWSDSNCSPAISIDPPNIEAALNVDDSIAFGERTTKKSSSSSFVAGSRILQTLDSITRGRAKTGTRQWIAAENNAATRNDESPCEQGQSKRQTLEASNPGNASTSKARKRCAADMLGLSNHSESFKIPYTPGVGGDTRRKMSSGSAADAALKIITEARQARANAEKKMNETVEPHDDGNTDNPDTQNNVRFIVYQEEPDSKQRSFLIQAEEPATNDETAEKGGGKVRECGPFLLGNVEIRMTEVNGTLNIWGKEIGESNQEQEVAMETEDSGAHDRSSFMPRASFVCQSTPHPKCPHGSTPPVSVACSRVGTSDEAPKPRISPRFGRTGIGKYLRTAASNLSRNNSATDTSNNGVGANSPRTNDFCEHCETHRQKPIKWPSCEHHHQARLNQHSCCLHNPKRECDCASDNDVFEDSTIYEAMSNILAGHEKCNAINVTSKHTCTNARNEEICATGMSCRHTSLGREEDARQTKKHCSSCKVDDPCARVRLTPVSCRSQSLLFCEDEAHPLLSSNPPCETPETKRRRLSGKKVRGILTDLLRGCSGCREPNSTSSLPRANRQAVASKTHLAPCSPAEASCSKRTLSCPSHLNHSSNEATNERCCNSCSRRAEMRAEIENQLEVFRVTMEQLRSRSDTVLEMLHLLKAETD